jgi:hypothetical protein
MRAHIILTNSNTSEPPDPPVTFGWPRPVLDARYAKLLCNPRTAGAGFTLAAASGSGLDLIRAVLEEVVFGAGLLWVRNYKRNEDDLDLSVRIPVGTPASMIRVKIKLSGITEPVLAWLRHLVETREITLEPDIEYDEQHDKHFNPQIVGWTAPFRCNDFSGELVVHCQQRFLQMEIKPKSS